MKKIYLFIMLSTVFFCPTLFSKELTRQEHRALATLHRWFQFYESKSPNYFQQLSILADDVKFKFPGREAQQGRDQYIERTTNPASFSFGQYSHHVKSKKTTVVDSNTTIVESLVEVQSTDGNGEAREGYSLNYRLEVVDNGGSLPKIKDLQASFVQNNSAEFQASYQTNTEAIQRHEEASRVIGFIDSSEKNEIISFVHHWYKLFDRLPKDHNFNELMESELEGFHLRQEFNTREEFLSAYEQMRKMPMKNSHFIYFIDIRPGVGPNERLVDVYMLWQNEITGKLNSMYMMNRMSLRKTNGRFKIFGYLPRSINSLVTQEI